MRSTGTAGASCAWHEESVEVLVGAQDIAMAGVAVMLLIVMMLVEGTTPHHSTSPADMAKVKHAVSMPGAKREDAINIILSRDGAIYFGHSADPS